MTNDTDRRAQLEHSLRKDLLMIRMVADNMTRELLKMREAEERAYKTLDELLAAERIKRAAELRALPTANEAA